MTDEYLYVKDAARLAGCSTKTLYRRMKRRELAYTTGENQRRLIRAVDAMAVATANRVTGGAQTTPLIDERLRRIEQKLDQLFVLQEKLLALYQPRSLATLASKHTRR